MTDYKTLSTAFEATMRSWRQAHPDHVWVWALRDIQDPPDEAFAELILELGGEPGESTDSGIDSELTEKLATFFKRDITMKHATWTPATGWFQAYLATLEVATLLSDGYRVGLVACGSAGRRIDCVMSPVPFPMEHLLEQRDSGIAHVMVRSIQTHANARDVADALAQNLNLSALGRAWVSIDRMQAQEVLTLFLSRDMAYHIQSMNPDTVAEFCAAFFACVSSDAVFFTNSHFKGTPSRQSGWTPLTASTFDCGVAAIDLTTHIAALTWAEDED